MLLGPGLPEAAAEEAKALGTAWSDCKAWLACFAAFSLLARAFRSAGVSSAWGAAFCSAEGTAAALPVTSVEACFAGPCFAVAWLPALCAAFDGFNSRSLSAGIALSRPSEGCMLLLSWRVGPRSEVVGELGPVLIVVFELEPGRLPDICLSLSLRGIFSVSLTCK